MKHMGNRDYSLWDEQDGFFYDVLRYPDGRFHKLRVRSLVGLIPLFAVERLEESWIEPFEEFRGHLHWFLKNRKDLVSGVVHTIEHKDDTTHALTIVNQEQIRRITRRIMDPKEFLSDYGVEAYPRPTPSTPSSSTARPSATSPPRRSASSRAATRTGEGRSGSRPASS